MTGPFENYTISNKNYANERGNKKVEFIKAIRSAFNLGLKEAKEVADTFDMTKVERQIIYDVRKHDVFYFGMIEAKLLESKEAEELREGLKNMNVELIGMTEDLLEAKLYDRARILIDALEKLEAL